MTRPNSTTRQTDRPTETLPELDAELLARLPERGQPLQEWISERDTRSLLCNPYTDLDTETVEWLAEREAALRASEGGHGLG
jgi:hypothetical protein